MLGTRGRTLQQLQLTLESGGEKGLLGAGSSAQFAPLPSDPEVPPAPGWEAGATHVNKLSSRFLMRA